MTDKKVGIEIGVGVTGGQDVDKLGQAIDGLGGAAADAGKKADTGAQGVRQLDDAAKQATGGAGRAAADVNKLGSAADDTGKKATTGAQGVKQLDDAAKQATGGAGRAAADVNKLGGAAAEAGTKADTAAQGVKRLDDAAKQATGGAGRAAADVTKLGAAAQGAAGAATQAGAAVSGMGAAAQQAEQKLTGVQREVAGTSAKLENMQKQLGSLAAQLAGAFTFREIVQAAAQMEQLQAGLKAVAGDGGVAAEQMAFVRRMAQAAGVDVEAAGKAFLGLAAATKGTAVEGEPARQVFEAVTVAMAKAGKGSAETSNALLALAQIASKGTVQMEELRGQLGEALPGALQATAAGLGITTQDLIKLVESGQLAAEDLFPALAKGLNELYGGAPAAQTLSQEITNIKNAFVEMAANLGEEGGLSALKVGAEAAQTAIVFLGESLIETGQAIGVLAAAATSLDFSGLSAAFEKIETDARERLLKAAEHNAVLTAALRLGADEATKAALAAQEAAKGHELAGAAAAKAGTSVAKLAVEYGKARKELEQQIDLASKEAESVKARGQAAVAQASALSDEAAKRKAVGEAAETEAQALEKLAKLRVDEVGLLEREAAAKASALAARGPLNAQRQQELKDMDDLIAKKKVEADTTLAQAAAAREKAKASSVEVQAAQALNEAAQVLNINRVAGAKASLSELQAQRDLVVQAKELAKWHGNEALARELNIKQLEIEIRIVRARAQVSQVEAEGSIAVARAKRAELEASGQLTPLKRAEIDASIKLAEAKIVEAKAVGASTELLEKQVQALKDATAGATNFSAGANGAAAAQDGLAAGTTKSTAALDGQADAFGRVAAAASKAQAALKGYDSERFALDANGRRVSVAVGDGSTYSPAAAQGQVEQAQAKYDAALEQFNRLANNAGNGRAVNGAQILTTGVSPKFVEEQRQLVVKAAAEAGAAAQAARAELDAAKAAQKQAQENAARSREVAEATAGLRASADAAAKADYQAALGAVREAGNSTQHTVTITLPSGSSRTFNTATAADARGLSDWLAQLSTDAASASGR